MLDGGGVYGAIFHYALFFFLMGSALIIFINLWCRGKLDMDESPKIEMLKDHDREV